MAQSSKPTVLPPGDGLRKLLVLSVRTRPEGSQAPPGARAGSAAVDRWLVVDRLMMMVNDVG